MKDLKIEPTQKSPAIELKAGELSFSGCSIINDPKEFFAPVNDWIKEYLKKPEKETVVNIKFEYIDSASVKSFFDILKDVEKLGKKKSIVINWYYDINDPEILELGEIIQSRLKVEFRFVEEG
jgi:HKD family nuclease